jgi:16S rRNA G966 N2-methylase RsmD
VPLLEELDQRGMLGSASHVVAQSEKKGDLPEVMGNLKTAKVRIYGATRISVFKNEEDS